MGRVSCKLRIGEKIGLSFVFVGLPFLGVIWQYQVTLDRSLADYQHLQNVFETSKSLALARRIARAQAVGKTRGYADAIDKAAKARLAALAVLMEDTNSLGGQVPLAVEG